MLQDCAAWKKLEALRASEGKPDVRKLFSSDAQRFQSFHREFVPNGRLPGCFFLHFLTESPSIRLDPHSVGFQQELGDQGQFQNSVGFGS
jgi:hypothetical protein